jgi:RNA polymerase sigma factor (sigma-70 family)
MSMPLDPDKQLLEQCLQGAAGAWQAFIQKFSPLVYYAIQKVLRGTCPAAPREDLTDLHNDIFLALIENNGRKLRQYEGKNGCSVSTWIRVIAVRATIDHLKKRKELLSLSDEATQRLVGRQCAAGPPPGALLEQDEEKKRLHELIDSLAPRDQLFIRLFYYDEVAPEKIAKIFKTTTNAIYSRGNYIREKLKESLQKKASKKKR